MKPMLAAKDLKDLDQLEDKFPLLASPKLDGIRAIKWNGQMVSRRLKPLPNKYLQQLFSDIPDSLDGEVIVGDPCSPTCFNTTTSGVMSQEGEPDVVFHIFDKVDVSYTFEERQRLIKQWLPYDDNIKLVSQTLIRDRFQLIDYEQEILELGYEGVMLRSRHGPYKFGRSTLREGHLMKLKRFEDSEARIVDVGELMHNHNEQKRDKLGRSKRSSHKENMVPGDTLGKLYCIDIHNGKEVELGSGFTAQQRQELWDDRQNLNGKIVKYKHFPVGAKDKPRHPVFLGFRKD